MKRYRVRLQNGRVVGPFDEAQILELKRKEKISGDESLQLFPNGEWLPWSEYNFSSGEVSEKTFVFKLDDMAPEIKPKEIPIDIEKIYQEKNENLFEIDIEKEPVVNVKEEEGQSQTEVKELIEENADRTILTPVSVKIKEELKKQKALEELKKQKEAEIEDFEELTTAEEVDYENERTQVWTPQEIKNKNNEDVEENERELEKKERFIIREKLLKTKKDHFNEQKNDQGPEKKKKPILLILGVLILIFVFLFPAEDTKKVDNDKINILEPNILYPVPFEVEDSDKSKILYNQAIDLLKQNKLSDKIMAADKLRESYENSVVNSEALYKLIRVYGELIYHSQKIESDGNQLFKLIQANQVQLTLNSDVVLGAGHFYLAVNKLHAALRIVERFIRAKTSPPSKEVFALYLEMLVRDGQDKTAQEVFEILNKVQDKSEIVSSALIRYLRSIGSTEEASSLLKASLLQFPNSCLLLSVQGEMDVELQNIKSLTETTQKIKNLKADNSKLYYAKYLEFSGLLLAYQKKNTEAAKLFNEAIELKASDSLIETLSNIKDIDERATDEGSMIIKKAKAYKLTNEAQKNLDRGEYDIGILTALKATQLKSGYFPAERVLSRLQLKLGLANEALINMSELAKSHPLNKEIQFGYLDLLIEVFKFTEAKRVIAQLAQSPELRDSHEYAAANALLYLQMKDFQQGAIWLQKAINLNPLNDKSIFLLAQTLTRLKKFKEAKNYLSKAMELDPISIDYKIAYAALIYEQESSEAAIGYLYSVLEENIGNPKILGEIAIYYHRSGKQQQFADVKKQIEELPIKDANVYRFLARTALLDENYSDAEKYTNELIRIEPGDLTSMMQVGTALMEQQRFKEAALWFKRVKDQLPSYPKIGYFKARIEQYLSNFDQAKKDVEIDMAENGEYEEGFVLIGDIYTQQENYIEAEKMYKNAQRLNFKSIEAVLGLAFISFKKGQFEIALDLYKRGEKVQPGNPTIHRQLGEVYRFLGQGNLAIEAYKMYLELLPNASDKDQIEQHIRILE